MRDRTLAIVLTVVAVLLFACPGLAFLCFGLTDFIVFYGFNNPFDVTTGFSNTVGVLGVCIGFFLIVITVILGIFLLRKKSDTPPTMPDQPLPPTTPDNPLPPQSPDEPIPPSI